MANTNCLQDMKCPNPKCGSEEPFNIAVTIQAVVLVHDDGTEDTNGGMDTNWDDHSYCRCCECAHEGVVKDFRAGALVAPKNPNGAQETPEPSKAIIDTPLRELVVEYVGPTRLALADQTDSASDYVGGSALLAEARAQYAEGSGDNIEIDDNAKMSAVDFGVWVSAWVFVSVDDLPTSLRSCVLEKGEDPDDCTMHEHETVLVKKEK